jgi:flavin-dependent dehydrogenase
LTETFPLSTDVFVVGGGPAGLAAAVAARRRGFDVTLADCSIPPIDKACGEGVMPDGIAAAEALGIDLHAAGGMPFRGIRFQDGEAVVEADFPAGHGLGLRRTALHRLMVDSAVKAGVRVVWGPRVTGLTDGGVLAGGWCARGGSWAPMAANRPCAAGPVWTPASATAAATDSAGITAWRRGARSWRFTGATAASFTSRP